MWTTSRRQGHALTIEYMDVREDYEMRGKLVEELLHVELFLGEPDKATYNRASLQEPLRGMLIKLLQKKLDVFAWTVADMPGIDPQLVRHKLNEDVERKLVKRKEKNFALERQEAIRQEVLKLLKVGFIEEIRILEWLAKPIMVKKANDKWRMCVDFTNLNDACLKDCFLFLRIREYEPESNEEDMRLSLDLIDEVRDKANAKNEEYHKRASSYYNLKVKERIFRQGEC